MKNYDVLIFDADQTLFDFLRAEREALRLSMLDYKLAYDESYHLPIYKRVNHEVWDALEKGEITAKALKSERFRRFFDALSMEIDPVSFAIAYQEHLANGSYIYEGYEQLIEALSKEYTLLIITNGLSSVQSKRIRQSTIAHYFNDIIISEDVGVAKPDPKIFNEAFKVVGDVDKCRMLMIGDSLTSDIQGGINAGIDTCWYNPNKKEKPESVTPTYEVFNLFDLKRVIGDE